MRGFLRKRWGVSILLIIAVLAAGGAWYYYNQYLPAQAAPPTETIKTAQVQQGDLVISASGTGELVPAADVSLGFQTGGLLAEVLVEVGDQVEVGEVLARLDDTDARLQVAQEEISLQLAELELAELVDEPDAADLASARASLASARADLDTLTESATEEELTAARYNLLSDREALEELLEGASEEEITVAKADMEKAKIDLDQAQADYDKFAWKAGFEASPQAAALHKATVDYERAKANYELVIEDATDEELASARAKVSQAQVTLDELEQEPDPEDLAAAEAKVAQAQAQLDDVLDGASAEELEAAELSVEKARNSLAAAQTDLDETVLRAPFAGVITAVEAEAKEFVGTNPFITLADMGAPLVRIWVDETDLTSVALGNQVEIVFDEALPDYTFTGEIIRVDPALVTVDGTPAVQAWASIDLSSHRVNLLSGMTADVEVIAAEAKDTLLVPVQALRELSPGQYAVFVVNPNGGLELRLVEVGLKDFVNAQILSGLELGEVVSMGTIEGTGRSIKPPTGGPMMPPPPPPG